MQYRNKTAAVYMRALGVSIANELNSVPAIRFNEEWVVDGISQGFNGSSLHTTVENPSEAFNLLNLETGEVVGSATYNDVVIMISSLYYYLADKRDNPPEPEVIEVPKEMTKDVTDEGTDEGNN